MEENLVGYLLQALDAAEQSEIESALPAKPELQRQLDLLRQGLRPLETDREEIEAPAGLWQRALARVAEHICYRPPAVEPSTPPECAVLEPASAPEIVAATDPALVPASMPDFVQASVPDLVPASIPDLMPASEPDFIPASRPRLELSPTIIQPPAPSGRGWWRRADVLVAACLLLTVTMLIPPGLSYMNYRRDIAACQNNLREFYGAFRMYGDMHNGQMPNVMAVKAPDHVAGLVVPVLMDQMQNRGDGPRPSLNVICQRGLTPMASPTLRDIEKMDERDFEQYAAQMLGCYAYSLGYRDADNKYRSHRLEPDHPNNGSMPLMGDRPPINIDKGDLGNSPNHWGKGQNLLYSDGHITFSTTRNAGVEGDDVYTNVPGKVAAGQHRWDAVLGESKSKP